MFDTALEESVQKEGSIKRISLKNPEEPNAQESQVSNDPTFNSGELKAEELLEGKFDAFIALILS